MTCEPGVVERRPRCCRGYTLLEIVVSLGLVATVVVGLGSMMQMAVRLFVIHERRLEIQQAARRGLDRMLEELRWAEAVLADPLCGPAGLCPDRVTVRIPAGNPYRDTEMYEATFQHNVVQQELERRVGVGVNNIAAAIRALTFDYLDANGAVAANAADTRRIVATMTAASRTSTFTVRGDVALRNRPGAAGRRPPTSGVSHHARGLRAHRRNSR